MPLPRASANPSDAAEAARILRAKSPLLPSDFAKLDREAKKRAVTVTDEVSLDAIRDMRGALAKAKADGIEYREFVKTVGPKLHAQWGIDSPQLKTVFVNNVQQATNQAIVARLNRQRGKYPFWTIDVVDDEVTSHYCKFFKTYPLVLRAGHPWFAKNAPMRHHRCRSTLRGLTAGEAKKIGITSKAPDWPPQEGWGGSAPMGEYKANMSDAGTITMPFPNEHAARQSEPSKYVRFRRGTPKGFPAGLFAIYGITKDGKVEIQSIRAKRDKWSPSEFKEWLKQHEFKTTIEEASTEMKSVNADIGQGDVHTDRPLQVRKRVQKPTEQYATNTPVQARSAMARLERSKALLAPAEYAETRRNILKAYKRFGIKHEGQLTTKRFKGLMFRTNSKMTSIHVHHMSDRTVKCDGIEIDRAWLLDDLPSEPTKPVWIQLAKVGRFLGHPAGPFELTAQIFAEIAGNFRATTNRRIPIDYEHASEQDPTSGTIPQSGAGAAGWIIDMDNRGAAGLWGLVEWLPKARDQIRAKEYMFFSPAIRFGSKDRVSGQPIGARMSSGALTNNPFLDGMMPLAASDRAGQTERTTLATDYAYSMAEIMPKLRACLFSPGSHLADMATYAECLDAVCRLECMVDEFRDMSPDADLMTAVHAGANLGAQLTHLRDTMQMGLAVTIPELLAVIKQMIQHAIGIHEDEMHEEELVPSSRDMGDCNMDESTLKLRDAETKLVALMSEKQTLETKVAGLELQLADRSAKNVALETEVKTLRDEAQKRQEQDETNIVETAFATYKDTHKLTDAHKKSMLLTYRHDRATFDQLYPVVDPAQRHLLRNVVNTSARQSLQQGATEARTIMGGGGKSPEEMIQLADQIQRDKKCSKEEALSLAYGQSVQPRRNNAFAFPAPR